MKFIDGIIIFFRERFKPLGEQFQFVAPLCPLGPLLGIRAIAALGHPCPAHHPGLYIIKGGERGYI